MMRLGLFGRCRRKGIHKSSVVAMRKIMTRDDCVDTSCLATTFRQRTLKQDTFEDYPGLK